MIKDDKQGIFNIKIIPNLVLTTPETQPASAAVELLKAGTHIRTVELIINMIWVL